MAQIYSLDDVPVPANRSLHTLFAFYVYSHQDAPGTSEGQPFSKYHGLSAKSSSPFHTSFEMEGYEVFLPGNEYHKMPFYGWLLLIYVAIAVGWMVLFLRWWEELFNIQHCVTAVVLLGLVEVFTWWIFYNDWNSSGFHGRFLFIIAILASVVKSIVSHMLGLVAALGWGVARPYLDRQVMTKIQAVCFLYIVLDFIRESVLSFRHSHALSLPFVLLYLLPVSLLNGGILRGLTTCGLSSATLAPGTRMGPASG